MNRQTIDYGIDLGTTNSEIAVLRGTTQEVIKNNENFEYTPSAVWLDPNNRLYIGRRAKEKFETDPDNAFCEFKLQMGTDAQYTFARNGRKMRPEDLSAEILKSLKGDVKQRLGEDIEAAVITVPAAFELPQCEATKKAAQAAGLHVSPLVQEPVAAALAYGFQSGSDKVFWLVFDFGGGTFDAAVIQLRDGVIQVVNHGGDNHLGGKLIDWEIVEQLLVPAVTRSHKLADFRRGNPKWRAAIAKLKLEAEQAKIRVSADDSAEIVIDFLCQDDHGQPVRFEYELKRADVQQLAEPFIVRAVNICKRTLEEKRLGPGNIEKLVLVGGPTLMPYLRERLADRQHGLGIPLEFSVDPLTVVARGAAVFAGTQRLEVEVTAPVKAGQYAIQLEYKPVGPDVEPTVGGRVFGREGEDLSGFTIEFVNAEARPPWRSGKLGLSPNGAFLTTLWAEKGKQNTFLIELCNATGLKQETTPDRLPYTVGVAFSEPPLIHSVGVALANNEMECFLEKGQPLPARSRNVLRAAYDAKHGESGEVIRVPVVEGQNKRADRNRLIGTLTIHAHQLKRDVPAGSEIEITIDIDQSRLVRTKAYIPMLDEEYECELTLTKKLASQDQLRQDFDQQKKRLEEVRKQVQTTGDAKGRQLLQRIDEERMMHDVEASLGAAAVDRDAADKCEKRLLDLKLVIDQVEEALEWPALVTEAEAERRNTREIVEKYGTASDKQKLPKLERDLEQAVQARQPDDLRRMVGELGTLRFSVLREQPGFWVGLFESLEERRSSMRDPGQAEGLFQQGRRAINSGDVEGLKAVDRQLLALLPQEQQQQLGGLGSTVGR